MEIAAWAGDARSHCHKRRFERAFAGRWHAAVPIRVVVVQAGDGLVRHVRKILRRDVEKAGKLQQQVGGPTAHGGVVKWIGAEAFFEAKHPTRGIGEGLDPRNKASGAAKIDAALTLHVDRVGDDHALRVSGLGCGRQVRMMTW